MNGIPGVECGGDVRRTGRSPGARPPRVNGDLRRPFRGAAAVRDSAHVPRSVRPKPSAAPPSPWTSVPSARASRSTRLAGFAPPVPGDKDSGEFTLVLATFGLARTRTGYPLYTFAGHVFVSALHALGFGWAPPTSSTRSAARSRWARFARSAPARARDLRARPAPPGLALVRARAGREPDVDAGDDARRGERWHVAWAMLAALSPRCASRRARRRARRRPVRLPRARLGLRRGRGIRAPRDRDPVRDAAVARAAHRRFAPAAGSVPRRSSPRSRSAQRCRSRRSATAAWRAWHPAAAQWPSSRRQWIAVGAHLSGASSASSGGSRPRRSSRAARAVDLPRSSTKVPVALGSLVAWRPPASTGTAVAPCARRRRAAPVRYAFLYGVSDPAPALPAR